MRADVNILLATIPHTGTRFFLELLRKTLSRRSDCLPPDGVTARDYVFVHIEQDTAQCARLFRYIDACRPLVITTERHPEKVRNSWLRDTARDIGKLPMLYGVYRDLLAKYSPFVLSVDAPDRQERLDNLGRILGVNFITDWTPVGASQ